jgi:serine/threonine protein kinase/CRP-like cAMP-binding protein
MGSSASIQLSPRGSTIIEDADAQQNQANQSKKETAAPGNNKRNGKRIFERQETSYDLDITSLLVGENIDEPTKAMLVSALSGFFFLQSNADDANPKMDLLMKGMRREEFEEGFLLITEGESGSKLYVVESGNLEVTINGTVIREMARGNMLGELALLYDAPRSATVQCKTKCVLWSLSREIFKKIQAISATANQIQRARWLIASPELATLSAIDLSRLVGTLQAVSYNPGDKIINEGDLTSHIILIERGHAAVASSTLPNGATRNEVDKALGILRPREGKRRSVDFMSAQELGKYLENSNDTYAEEAVDEKIEKKLETLCEVYEGCMVGIGALRGRAKLDNAWKWVTREKKEGAESPLTLVATSQMNCLVFSVEVFENLFGPAEKAIKSHGARKGSVVDEKPVVKELTFDSTKFKMKYILGSGSFGVVTLAEYRVDKNLPPVMYALKSLSKLAVIETGQLRHVLDERRILSIMDSNFIMKLFGTYQTPHQLVMVTEPLNCGDLWSVVYETPPYCDNCGVPFNLCAFYTVNLVYGLSHIHEKGVVFRDLKPENIMLDDKGYLRIIDFGFSKKVPYTKTDANGEVKVYAKTYTLCGTPEYLSPELIFNLGHNHASDLWALGVIVYEMLMAVTPFAPKRPDNVTELFTNIAMVKKNGLVLSSRIDQHAGNPQARVLIGQILKADPAERIGVQEGSTRSILNHPFFANIDIEGIKNHTVVPEFIPIPNQHHEPLSNLMPVRPFNGDQTLFAEF